MKDTVRVILARVLIAWWAIPAVFLILVPMFWLLSGDFKLVVNDMRDFSKAIWNANI